MLQTVLTENMKVLGVICNGQVSFHRQVREEWVSILVELFSFESPEFGDPVQPVGGFTSRAEDRLFAKGLAEVGYQVFPEGIQWETFFVGEVAHPLVLKFGAHAKLLDTSDEGISNCFTESNVPLGRGDDVLSVGLRDKVGMNQELVFSVSKYLTSPTWNV